MLTAWRLLRSLKKMAAWLVIRLIHIYGRVGMLTEIEVAIKWVSEFWKTGIGEGRFDLYTC